MKLVPLCLILPVVLLATGCGPLGPSDDLSGKNFFVTSQLFSGNLNGTAGADLKCQLAATTAGLGGVYKAWLSDFSTDALHRVSLSYPLRRSTGLTVFANDSARISGVLAAAPNVDEYGKTVSTPFVWTNSDSLGYGLMSDCGQWTTDNGAQYGAYGNANSTNSSAWTQSGTATCDQKLRLYCIEQ
ncbi:MAG TPA: hypothetical protein PL182_12410 [Pseudobdellovibrionaceae bacterium]|nr:hypothetical protein [Pseudobdellovibrionaceae bacterium]